MDKKFDVYIDSAIKELYNPTFNLIKQYLEVMEVEKESGIPKVARIDDKQSDSDVMIYFHVKDERFFIVINVTKKIHSTSFGHGLNLDIECILPLLQKN